MQPSIVSPLKENTMISSNFILHLNIDSSKYEID